MRSCFRESRSIWNALIDVFHLVLEISDDGLEIVQENEVEIRPENTQGVETLRH